MFRSDNILMQKGAYSNSSSWFMKLKVELQNSLVVQWLGLRAFTAKGLGSIPRWGTKIPQAARHSQKKKKKNEKQKLSSARTLRIKKPWTLKYKALSLVGEFFLSL